MDLGSFKINNNIRERVLTLDYNSQSAYVVVKNDGPDTVVMFENGTTKLNEIEAGRTYIRKVKAPYFYEVEVKGGDGIATGRTGIIGAAEAN